MLCIGGKWTLTLIVGLGESLGLAVAVDDAEGTSVYPKLRSNARSADVVAA